MPTSYYSQNANYLLHRSPVNVVFNVVRHVVVDDVLDHGEVETLRGDVRRHQDIFVALSGNIIKLQNFQRFYDKKNYIPLLD